MVPRRVDRPGWSPSSRRLTAVASLWLLCCSVATPSVYAATGSEGLGPALTAIDAIRALTPQVANQRHRVLIRGTITYINEREPAGIIVHDGRVAAVRALWPRILPRAPENRAASRRRRRGRRRTRRAKDLRRPSCPKAFAGSATRRCPQPGACRTRHCSAACSTVSTSRRSAWASGPGFPSPARPCSSTSRSKAGRSARGSGTFRPRI